MEQTVANDSGYETAIAIIGMAGRFPGANTLDAFWHNIVTGLSSIRFFSDDELLVAGRDPAQLQMPNLVKAGTMIDDVELFDATFFGYTPREAELMDPQHRLFLECAWEALERSGYAPETYSSLIGVFGGSCTSTYALHNIYSHPDMLQRIDDLQIAVANDLDALASTVSYKLNLRGPSITVQTFCSTSLVAVHLACQSLLTYDCDMALAGGVAISIPQGQGYLYQEGGMVSPDGYCRSFDVSANGSVPGNGLALVVLKRMEEALADGDQIYAIIKGSAINNDGVARVGYTAPGVNGEAAVIATALANAGIDSETISYIEAHGTGTPLGDSIELAAMLKTFQSQRKQFCAISTVKPNIGHLNRASGVAGLIKATLALTHRVIPPSLHFEQTNIDMNLEQSPFFVNTIAQEWEAHGAPRRAGVSSFGLGGTNVHIVLEEAPIPLPTDPEHHWNLLVWSAKTETALETMTANLKSHLQQHPDLNLTDVAFTLQIGRSTFNQRCMLVCSNLADAIATLETDGTPRVLTANQTRRNRPLAFLFPSQAEQFIPMARDLYQDLPAFRALIEQCCDLLWCARSVDIRTLLFSDRTPADQRTTTNGATMSEPDAGQMDQCWREQMTLFAVEYALARLLMLWGVEPYILLGKGIGEYVAACLAGVFTLEDALRLAADYAFLVVPTPAGQHAPSTAVIARDALNPPQLPLVSGTTGDRVTEEQATDPHFWVRQPRPANRLVENSNILWSDPNQIVLELGSGQGFSRPLAPLQLTGDDDKPLMLSVLPFQTNVPSGTAVLLGVLGQLWLAGVQIDWTNWYAHERRQRIALPTYPFERCRYWIEPCKGVKDRQTHATPHATEERRADITNWFYLPIWKQAPLMSPADPTSLVQQKSPWLIFADEAGIGARLVERLRTSGCLVTQVQYGEAFAAHHAHAYTIDPHQPGDYVRLLSLLDYPPKTIVHAWSLIPEAQPHGGPEAFQRVQEFGFYTLLYLAKALGATLFSDALDLWALSKNTYSVTGAETLAPEQATLAGACRVIPQEYLSIVCHQIDLELPPIGTWHMEKLVGQLLAEFVETCVDLTVAYRSGVRWTQTFESVDLPAPAPETILLRHKGVYLITGGLGGVGLVLAEHLARIFQARLVLTGRSSLPDRDAWDTWLATHEPEDPVSGKLRAVRALEMLGAEVLLVSADVADIEHMQRVIATTKQRFGALHGVLHAAGVSSEQAFGTIQEISNEQCESHFQPKTRGLYVLEQVLQSHDLDFCVLFSSLSSILGGLSFVAYSAANSFMDAFAQQHNRTHPTPWVSVNWDTWRLHEDQHAVIGATVATYEMLPTEGTQVLERVLAQRGTVAQIVLSTGDLQARLDQWVRMIKVHEHGRQDADLSPMLHPRPNLGNSYVAPTDETEERIAEIWQQVFGIAQIGIHDNFLELGGHSLLGTQLITRLRQAFMVNLPLTMLFEAPTIAEMALAIESALLDEMERLAEQEAFHFGSTASPNSG